ncbi:hypothetical protein [Chitinophaga rhizosphaerae]|uniref:hypothetical protein n=1 Tax=Chitinophaga rhizosphaerae TaxID=1864947 RepID=UPI000F810DAE|nr:hypothetical protein [Chitinophaga rhizosphaerae]
MTRKVCSMFALMAALVMFQSETSAIQPTKTKVPVPRFSCSFTQTNFSLSLTGNPATSYTYTMIDFAAHYFSTNPYTQAQWETGVVIGNVTGCTSSTRVRGTKVQSDGRLMECTISTSGVVVIRWVSGPPMPSSGPLTHYAVEFATVPMSAY